MSGAVMAARPSTTMTMAAASSRAKRAWRKDLGWNKVLVFRQDAAGIDHAETVSGPVGFGVKAVARNARLVADDSPARSDNAVKQRGLAHVRAADNGQQRKSSWG
jgi:hypothetical protein